MQFILLYIKRLNFSSHHTAGHNKDVKVRKCVTIQTLRNGSGGSKLGSKKKFWTGKFWAMVGIMCYGQE
jgi:hypothetical protein